MSRLSCSRIFCSNSPGSDTCKVRSRVAQKSFVLNVTRKSASESTAAAKIGISFLSAQPSNVDISSIGGLSRISKAWGMICSKVETASGSLFSRFRRHSSITCSEVRPAINPSSASWSKINDAPCLDAEPAIRASASKKTFINVLSGGTTISGDTYSDWLRMARTPSINSTNESPFCRRSSSI